MPTVKSQQPLYVPLAQRQNSGSTKPYSGGVDKIMGSIKKLESSGNYAAIGPKTKTGDQAYGAYQVMGANIPSWTKEVLGREYTPEEFLADQQAQDAVARTKMSESLAKYGSADDVASVWFTGRPVAKAGLEVADVTGTSNAKYLEKFRQGLGSMYTPLSERGMATSQSTTPTQPSAPQKYVPLAERSPYTATFGKLRKDINKATSSFLLGETVEDTKETLPLTYWTLKQRGLEDTDPIPEGFQTLDPAGAVGAMKKVVGKVVGKGAEVTLKTLNRLLSEVKSPTVGRETIEQMIQRADVKQPERDLIRQALGDEKTVNVADFANRVQGELLPLDTKLRVKSYEGATLPEELRGPIANYEVRVFQSPIKTSAGQHHFGQMDAPNYYGHVRIEDLPDGETRRIIETQSDLFQKGRLEEEADKLYGSMQQNPALREATALGSQAQSARLKGDKGFDFPANEKKIAELLKPFEDARTAEIAPLEPYRNNEAHLRMIRESVKEAAEEGKTKLQFPTGETAMKIQGLGETHNFLHRLPDGRLGAKVEGTQSLKVGDEISNGGNANDFVVTEILGDGKFKAVQKRQYEQALKDAETMPGAQYLPNKTPAEKIALLEKNDLALNTETFDISGTVDKENPIYKFYEKDVARYLKNKYGAKVITDPQGVTWVELDVPKDAARLPVEAFGLGPLLLPQDEKK